MDSRHGSFLLAVLMFLAMAAGAFAQINIAPCRDGDTRPCGSSVGACEKGTSTCDGGMWGQCLGGVTAVEENCGDGIDNDCNGLVDDCGFNTVSVILIGSGLVLLVVALILSKMGK
jgi:hypothetical protein